LPRILLLVVLLLALIPFFVSGSGTAAAPMIGAGILFQQADVTAEPAPTGEATAELTPVPVIQPGAGVVDTSEIPNYVMTFILVFVLALILLFGAVLVLLYRSVPAVFQSGINATLVKLFEKMQEMVAATPTKIDDALAEEIERRVWERINEASKPTLAVDIGEARAKILAGIYRQENEGGVG